MPGFYLISLLILLSFFCYFGRSVESNETSSSGSGSCLDLDWMETGVLGLESKSRGKWEKPHLCPPGSFVNGYMFQSLENNDLVSLQLLCSDLGNTFSYKQSLLLQIGEERRPDRLKSEKRILVHFVGFSFQRWTSTLGIPEVGNHALTMFNMGKIPEPKDKVSIKISCPDGWAICGAQPKIFKNGTGLAITQLRFKCCYYCMPKESLRMLSDYQNPESVGFTRQVWKSVGAQVDLSKFEDKETGFKIKTKQPELPKKGLPSKCAIKNVDFYTGGIVKRDEIDKIGAATTPRTILNNDDQPKIETEKNGTLEPGMSSDQPEFTQGFGPFGIPAEVTGNRSTVTLIPGSNPGICGLKLPPSNSNSIDQSPNDVRTAVEKSIKEGAEAMILKLGKEFMSYDFNWKMETLSNLTDPELTPTTWEVSCIPKHKCHVFQVNAQCGLFTVRTPQVNTTWEDINPPTCSQSNVSTTTNAPPTSRKPSVTPKVNTNAQVTTPGLKDPWQEAWDQKKPEGKWYLVKNMSFFEPSGQWTAIKTCPPSRIVTAHQFKMLHRVGLTGVALTCRETEGKQLASLIVSEDTPVFENAREVNRGRWSKPFEGSLVHYATGFSFHRMLVSSRGSGNQTNQTVWSRRPAVGNQQFRYKGLEPTPLPTWIGQDKDNATLTALHSGPCPNDHAICGLSTMVDKHKLGVITGLAFQCCSLCVKKPAARPPTTPRTTTTPRPVRSTPRPNQSPSKAAPVERSGDDLWFFMDHVQFGPSESSWNAPELCSPGAFVNGWKIKEVSPDDGRWMGILLICSKYDETEGFTKRDKDIQSAVGEVANPNMGWTIEDEDPMDPVVGFYYFKYNEDIREDGRSLRGVIFNSTRNLVPKSRSRMYPDIEFDSPIIGLCPKDDAVCGLSTKLDTQKEIITGIKIRCCPFGPLE